ncbi:unnamed protein product [Chrysoparadoxa australica]
MPEECTLDGVRELLLRATSASKPKPSKRDRSRRDDREAGGKKARESLEEKAEAECTVRSSDPSLLLSWVPVSWTLAPEVPLAGSRIEGLPDTDEVWRQCMQLSQGSKALSNCTTRHLLKAAGGHVYYCIEERLQSAAGQRFRVVSPTPTSPSVEKTHTASVNRARELTQGLASVYSPGKASFTDSHVAWYVQEAQGKHRAHPGLQHVPDVLVVKCRGDGRVLHFAPAMVLQLLETDAGAAFVSCLPPRIRAQLCDVYPQHLILSAALTHLYVPVLPAGTKGSLDSSPFEGSLLLPAPECALRGLLQLHVARAKGWELGPARQPHSSDVIPDVPSYREGTAPQSDAAVVPVQQRASSSSSSHNRTTCCHRYVLVLNPGTGQATAGDGVGSPWENATALFVQLGGASLTESVSRTASSKALTKTVPKHSKKAAPKWDEGILSSLCRWRGCMCEGRWRNLCSYHSELRDFIDAGPVVKEGRGGATATTTRKGGRESSRFLPRKPPTAPVGDLNLIKASSNLLMELLNGKLAATTAAYCRKAAIECSAKRGKRPSYIPPEASWVKWLDEGELDRAKRTTQQQLHWTQCIADCERAVTSELQRLMELGVYPAAELALIRADYTVLEREWMGEAETDCEPESERSELEIELDFCERKRMLLRRRREEIVTKTQWGSSPVLAVQKQRIRKGLPPQPLLRSVSNSTVEVRAPRPQAQVSLRRSSEGAGLSNGNGNGKAAASPYARRLERGMHQGR